MACPHEFDVSLDSWCINSLFEKEKYTRKVSAFIIQARIHFDRNSKWHWKWSICRTSDVTNFFLNFKLLFFLLFIPKKNYEFASHESIMKVFHSIKFSCFIFQHIYFKLPIFRFCSFFFVGDLTICISVTNVRETHSMLLYIVVDVTL